MTAWGSGSKYVSGIEVSAQDNRLYRAFVLPNQLQVFLVSDPSTEKAAASLAVQVGHQSDPRDLPGLAHFCEHMLFLGTQKYPEETSYKTYLSAHGGRSNASTSAIATNYYFDVATPHLYGALDRFAQFFIAPLFTESATEREMHAIDAENAKNLMDDSRRLYQLMKSLANPLHPFHKFGTGNLDTLGVRPKALGIDVRAELLAFHKKHYSANTMKLVIYGKDDLNTLEGWATSLFSPIENKDVNPYLPGNTHPYESEQQGRYINVIPVKDLRSLELTFPLPSMQSMYLSKPNRVLSHLLGHEGSGSLCAYLKALGLATGVSAGLTRDYKDWSQFSIKISLTPMGLLEIPNIVKACFQYLRILHQTDASTMQMYFEETRKINSLQFQYQNKQAPINFVSYLTRNLQLYPVHHVASGPYILDNYVDANLRQVLALLTPDRLRLILTARDGIFADKIEPWLGAAYSDGPLDQEWLDQWSSIDNIPTSMHIPAPNPYIPTRLDLQPSLNAVEPILDAENARLWYKPGNSFEQPKASVRFKWYHPIAYSGPLECVLTELYTLWLEEVLTESIYDADVAGLKVHISNTTAGITLHIVGYDETIPLVLDTVLTHRFASMDEELLLRLKEKLSRDFANTLMEEPYRWASYQRQLALSETKYPVQNKLEALKSLTEVSTTLAAHAHQIFNDNPHVEGFVYGNMDKTTALKLMEAVQPSLQPGIFHHAVPESRNLALENHTILQLHCPNPRNPNSAVHMAFECGRDSIATRAATAVLAQTLKVPCFTTLRTTEQLGYIVSSTAATSNGNSYVHMTVQSNVYVPETIESRIEAFLESFQSKLAEMSDSDFEKHKDAVIVNLLEKPKMYEEESSRLWDEISVQTYMFDRRAQIAASVQTLSKATIMTLLNSCLVEKSTRKALSTQIWPANEPFSAPSGAITVHSLEDFKKGRKNRTKMNMVIESSVLTFGCNDDGQLGRGDKRRFSITYIDTISGVNQPQQVGSLRGLDVIAVSCGSRHSLALTSAGEVFSWGWGQMGQLGNECLKTSNVPTRISFFEDSGIKVVAISAGGCHSGAVSEDGRVFMWGEAHWGQLGLTPDYKDVHQATPAECKILPDDSTDKIIALSCGGTHTAALSEQGHVYTWGRRDNGQLGLGRDWVHMEPDAPDGMCGASIPTQIDPAHFESEKVVQISCGAFHTAAITESGQLYTWGKEDYGMLGIGHTPDIHVPHKVSFFESIPALSVSCGGWHTAVVTRSGECYVFGRGEYGRLGLGDNRSHSHPRKVQALASHHIVQAAAGGSHTLFLTDKGEAFSCGRPDHGRLGNSDLKNCATPEIIQETCMGTIPVIQVAAGGAHSACLLHSARLMTI